jgi:hypothetical protein
MKDDHTNAAALTAVLAGSVLACIGPFEPTDGLGGDDATNPRREVPEFVTEPGPPTFAHLLEVRELEPVERECVQRGWPCGIAQAPEDVLSIQDEIDPIQRRRARRPTR